MRMGAGMLFAVLVAAACSRAADEPQGTAGGFDAGVAQQVGAAAGTNAGKPLIHVWKSPT